MAGFDDIKKAAEEKAKAAVLNKIGLGGTEQTNQYTQSSVISPEVSAETRKVGLSTGVGDLSQVVTRSYFGYNHRGTGLPIELNTDQYGLVFFTRPALNLSYDNIANDRTFAPLLTNQPYTTHRAIRAWLDPYGSHLQTKNSFHTPLVDDLNPFITILSNCAVSLNGWPDPYVETYVSNEGRYKEQWGMIDGPAKIYNSFTINATFRNIVNDPISQLFNVWTQYAARVYEGFFDPRPDMILENTVDYETRIYRVVLDKSRRYVQSIGACGAGFPVANNKGAKFNFNIDKPFNQELDQISVGFLCFGAMYDDPILVDEFNRTVELFNFDMGDGSDGKGTNRKAKYVLLTMAELPLFNTRRTYPRIDPETMEMQWWTVLEDYMSVLGIQDTSALGKVGNLLQKVDDVKNFVKDPLSAIKR